MAWYGNWAVVVASILFFTLFVVGFAYAPKKRDWNAWDIRGFHGCPVYRPQCYLRFLDFKEENNGR